MGLSISGDEAVQLRQTYTQATFAHDHARVVDVLRVVSGAGNVCVHYFGVATKAWSVTLSTV